MAKFPVTISFTRRIRLENVPVDHPNHGVVFQVLQEPSPANPYYYVRNEATGELGFFDKERVQL